MTNIPQHLTIIKHRFEHLNLNIPKAEYLQNLELVLSA